jgi:hypothetical protein
MSDAALTDEQARKAFTRALLVSLALGVGLGFLQYGTLLDFRAWNLIGLAVILGVSLWAAVLGLKARCCRNRDAS